MKNNYYSKSDSEGFSGAGSASGTAKMWNHQKAQQLLTNPCQLHTSMSLVVMSQTVPLSSPLPGMIPKTGILFVLVGKGGTSALKKLSNIKKNVVTTLELNAFNTLLYELAI